MNCKKCGTELDDNARFCPQCGALQPLICPECGAESRPGSRVCSSCGKKLPVAVHEEPLVDYPRRKKYTTNHKIAIAAIAVVAVLVLTGAVLFLTKTLGSIDKEQEPPIDPPAQTEDQPELEPIPEPKPEPKPEDSQTPGTDEKQPEEDPEKKPEEDPASKPGEADPEKKPEEDPAGKPGEAEPEKKPEEKPEEPKPEEPKPEEPKPENSEWIFPDSSERRLTEQDIAGMSKAELRLARNEIYARHGRIFKAQDLKDYFSSRSWYKGTIAPGDFKEDALNEVERANVNFLKAAE